jgi:hypothetical protein
VRACIKLGRTFIHNIVDRLHVVVMMAANDSKDLGDHILEEVSRWMGVGRVGPTCSVGGHSQV